MDSALDIHRFQFAFTITYHYLYPQLTMGLALLVFVFQTVAWRRNDEVAAGAAQFWGRIFALAFGMGVVTGIPMEFQFGTNWAAFSDLTGGIIGQTLAMEGIFSFFLESTFLGLMLLGRKRLGPRGIWLASLGVFVGAWLSGYFIVATNAWMQHPVGYEILPDGRFKLVSLNALFTNPWLLWQYPHTMLGAVITGATAVCGVGALYLLQQKHIVSARFFLRVAVPIGLAASVLAAFPTGDQRSMAVARYQPITFAAMEAVFKTEEGAPLVLIGQPDVDARRIDNAIHVPKMLSFLTYKRWNAEVRGLEEFPEEDWPDSIPLLYFTYHMMVGLGTIFIGIYSVAAFLLWRGRLERTRPWLWILTLLVPFPFIANTAGWLTTELGRQPWIVHGLLRTADGASANVSSGNALFSLIGFMGLYALLSVLFLSAAGRILQRGPEVH